MADAMTQSEALAIVRQRWPLQGAFAVRDGQIGKNSEMVLGCAVGYLIPQRGPAEVVMFVADAFEKAIEKADRAEMRQRERETEPTKPVSDNIPWAGNLFGESSGRAGR